MILKEGWDKKLAGYKASTLWATGKDVLMKSNHTSIHQYSMN